MDREHDRLWREIERVRDRVHGFGKTIDGLRMLVSRNRERLDELEPQVRELTAQEEIAEAIAEKLDERDQARESRWRVWSIRIGIGTAIGSFVLLVLREFGLLG